MPSLFSLRRFFALELLGAAMWSGVAIIGAAAGCLVLWSLVNPRQWKPLRSAGTQPQVRTIASWFLSRTTPKWFLVSAAVLVLGGTWLFFGILEDVISGDPLVVVDAMVHDAIQSLRTPVVDRFMVGLTELGDVQVVIPVSWSPWDGSSHIGSGAPPYIGLRRSAWPRPW